MAIRLVALDIDGTLLDSRGSIPEANRRAVAEALDRGIEVVLVTGRRFDFARPVVETLPGPLTFITTNGALVRTRDGVTLRRRLLEKETARQVLEGTAAFRHTTAVVFDRPDRNQVVYERIDWNDPKRGGYFEAQRRYLAEVDPLEESLTEDPLQVMFTGGFEEMRAVLALLEELVCAEQCVVTSIEYEARDFSLVDVMGAGCSKGSALADVSRALGIRREEILAIGDNLNDVAMLEYAGVAVVMGNAVDELKTLGWPVTRSNDESGVATAIETFAFGL